MLPEWRMRMSVDLLPFPAITRWKTHDSSLEVLTLPQGWETLACGRLAQSGWPLANRRTTLPYVCKIGILGTVAHARSGVPPPFCTSSSSAQVG